MMKPETPSAVQKVFTPQVSKTYERVNHVITLGLDVLWRRKAARIAAAGGGTEWADMCTGTGETAMYLSRLAPPETKVHGVDFSEAMLEVAQRKPEAKDITFVVADVKNLAFDDNSLDIITISFATRNINVNKDALIQALKEFHRVLKPGGRFVNLETSQPKSRLIRWCFHAYVKAFVKIVGGAMSGSYSGYAYLRHTIPRFYDAEGLRDIMQEAGFTKVEYKTMMFGIAAIHQGVKG